tara:strand:- start:2617 stop:3195 length:579 start_codon:yes stop_codon:yes gene_type:complete
MLIFSDNFNEALDTFFKRVKKQARQNLSKGTKLQKKRRPINNTKKLYNSIKYAKFSQNERGQLWGLSMEDYGDYIDKGVKGTKSNYRVNKNTPFKFSTKRPPSIAFEGWAKARNIRFRDAEGKFKKGNYKSISYVIAKSIFEKGIRANNFFTIPFVNEYKKLPNELQNIFADDMLQEMIESIIEADLEKKKR